MGKCMNTYLNTIVTSLAREADRHETEIGTLPTKDQQEERALCLRAAETIIDSFVSPSEEQLQAMARAIIKQVYIEEGASEDDAEERVKQSSTSDKEMMSKLYRAMHSALYTFARESMVRLLKKASGKHKRSM